MRSAREVLIAFPIPGGWFVVYVITNQLNCACALRLPRGSLEEMDEAAGTKAKTSNEETTTDSSLSIVSGSKQGGIPQAVFVVRRLQLNHYCI